MLSENYDAASRFYAENRRAVGIEIILGSLAYHGMNLSSVDMIDMGCGSGKYSLPLSKYLNKITGIDLSEGQIQEARKASKEAGVSIEYIQHDIRNVNFVDDKAFDLSLMSVVLHHIRSDDGNHFEEQKKVLSELARVTKVNGLIIIATCSHRQVSHGAWYCEMMPEHIIKLRQSYYAEFYKIDEYMRSKEFLRVGKFIDSGKILHGDQYGDYRNVYSAEYRKTDSIFSSLSSLEIDSFINTVREAEKNGEIDKIIKRNADTINNQGQVTFLVYKGKDDGKV